MSKKEIPKYNLPIFETHTHLDYLKERTLEELIVKLNEFNISKLMTIAVSVDHLDQVLQLANSNESFFCSQGIHPHEAKTVTQDILLKIKTNIINNPKVLAVGEIGLDYHYDNSPRKIQQKVFEQFLDLAINLDRPVIIHTREAEDDTIDILKNFISKHINKHKIVIHSFTASQKLADYAADNNIYIGVNGIITFKKSQQLRDTIKTIPKELLVLETDAPFLSPAPFRGKENSPFYLPVIAQKLAEITERKIADVLEQCWANSHQLFGLKP